jgi:hypothetical protein
MLGSSRVAAQLAASREGLGSMSEYDDHCIGYIPTCVSCDQYMFPELPLLFLLACKCSLYPV